jgi:hypothetical protein
MPRGGTRGRPVQQRAQRVGDGSDRLVVREALQRRRHRADRDDATLTADFAAGSGGEPLMPGYDVMLSRLVPPDGFPALHRAIASGSLDDEDDIDAEFSFGLERILDGIDALIRQQ